MTRVFEQDVVYRSDKTGGVKLLTVFLGLYEAAPYICRVRDSIAAQHWTSEQRLVVVDNASTFSPFNDLFPYLADLPCDVLWLKNRTNYQALGSLYASQEFITTPWLTFMHQDDLYFSNFVSSIGREIHQFGERREVMSISFDYSTVRDGGAPSHSANPTWFARSGPPHRVFLQNLANHSVPWPSTVFRAEYLFSKKVPFHSSAFPDTEIALLQAGSGECVYVPEVVMAYHEEVTSGSRNMVVAEQESLRLTSLLRVFFSAEFKQILESVDDQERGPWVSEVLEAGAAYFASEPLKTAFRLAILENLVFGYSYEDEHLNLLLADELSRLGANGAAKILSNIHGLHSYEEPRLQGQSRGPTSRKSQFSFRYFASKAWHTLPRRFAIALFRLLPKRMTPRPWKFFKD